MEAEDDYDADFEAFEDDDEKSPLRNKKDTSEAPSSVTKLSTPWKMANKSSIFEDDDELLKPIPKATHNDKGKDDDDENIIDDNNNSDVEGWEESKSKPSSAPASQPTHPHRSTSEQVNFSTATQVINTDNKPGERSKPRFAPVNQPKKQTIPTGVIIRNRPLVSHHAKATPSEPSAPKPAVFVPRPPPIASKPSDSGSVGSSSHHKQPATAPVAAVISHKPAVPPAHIIHSEPSQHSESTHKTHHPADHSQQLERQLQIALQQLKHTRREITNLKSKLDETNSNEQNNNFKYELSQREKRIKELEKENTALKQLSKYQEKHLNELSNLDSEHEALEQEKFIATMTLHMEKLKARIVEYRNLKEDQDDRIADLNDIARKQRMKIAKLKKTVMMMQEKGGFNSGNSGGSHSQQQAATHASSSSHTNSNNTNNSSSRRIMKKGSTALYSSSSKKHRQQSSTSSNNNSDPAATSSAAAVASSHDPTALVKIERRYQLQLQLTQRDLNIARTEATNKDNLRVKLEAELKSREHLIKKQLMQLKALKAQHEGLSLQYKHLLSTSETLISNTQQQTNNRPPPPAAAPPAPISPVATRKVIPLASPPKERARSKKAALVISDSSDLPLPRQSPSQRGGGGGGGGSAVFLTSESY